MEIENIDKAKELFEKKEQLEISLKQGNRMVDKLEWNVVAKFTAYSNPSAKIGHLCEIHVDPVFTKEMLRLFMERTEKELKDVNLAIAKL